MKKNISALTPLANGETIRLKSIPSVAGDIFASTLVEAVNSGMTISACFGIPGSGRNRTLLYALLADDDHNCLYALRAGISGDTFQSITPLCPQAHLFEREIAEQTGLRCEGHPWFRPVRYHRSPTGRDAWNRKAKEPIQPAAGDFYRIEGDVHEVSVGPVHAGVIEPGHFRFQCHGEEVLHLEIALGYQHRGIEEALKGGPDRRSLHLAETIAGDTTIAHATCYCQIIESLCGCRPAARAQSIAGTALELERLANHTGDLGALSGDVGYLPTASFCGRLRGDLLNMTALLCGSRFGRGMMRPGGTRFDMNEEICSELLRRLDEAERDITIAVNLLWDTQSVVARFSETGRLSRETAEELGIVGLAARASGLSRDARFTQPSGIFRMSQIPLSTAYTGDVYSRAMVRWLEITRSIAFIREQVHALPAGPVMSKLKNPAPDSLTVAINEGWRGEVCHVAITDGSGRFARYKIVDPSFHNWQGLAHVLRGQDISDFPLCNKSFNLSYCGHDL
jgi:Ni,Fe-hydrogenase III large subunit